MEKQVKGATKLKLAAPKSKYITPILAATNNGESGVGDVFRTLQLRIQDSTWTIAFKGLIVVHLMIREGQPDVTLRYLAASPRKIAISSFSEIQTQGHNIQNYSEYLFERVRAYQSAKTDYVRSGAGKMRNLTVDKGLLRQTEIVQDQIRVLLKCDFLSNADYENEIAITAFRLVTLDLLELFKVMNEGTINVLEHYFEMSKVDAEKALNIYKTFGRQTEQVVQYLSAARQYQTYTKLEVPKLKHAPTTLTTALEDYLNDPDFEINRRQYLVQQEAKRSGKPVPNPQQSQPTPFDRPAATSTQPSVSMTTGPTSSAAAKGPAPDLIDFFESIEQNQQPMMQSNIPQQQFNGGYVPQQVYQQSQMLPQQTGYNPFMQSYQQQQQQLPTQQMQNYQQPQQLQPDFTGAGFGGYGPQPPQQTNVFGFQPQLSSIPQDDIANFQQSQPQPQAPSPFPGQSLQAQPTTTNPFRQSMLAPQSTNPFARAASASPPPQQQTQQQLHVISHQALQPQATGTNPFAKARSPPPVASPISVNVTGSTNPFRQSQFVSQATGQGWQHSNQGTFAGYNMNNVDTTPVFPRPGA